MTNSKLIYIEDDQILGNLITQALVDYGFEIDFRTTLNGLQESLAPSVCEEAMMIGSCGYCERIAGRMSRQL